MRTLVIESATEACSTALFDGSSLIAGHSEVIGRGHAERLVPMIAELPDRGHAERIAVSLGPGSFTGVRIGLAAARALGLAWRSEVWGYPTLALVAAMVKDRNPVTVAMTGGHGEWFVQDFDSNGLAVSDLASLRPTDAARRKAHRVVAGSQAVALGALLEEEHVALSVLPDARQFANLPESLLSSDLSPLYGRPPDARLPGNPG